MAEMLQGTKRTNMCGELNESHIGKNVTVMGWVQRKRNLGGLVFVDIRDRSGILQSVFDNETNEETFKKADTLKSEYCIAVTGTIVKRESPNKNMPTGMIELKGEKIKILSESETPPIYIKENLDTDENVRMKYRYLDLRRPDMQRIFRIRHKVAKCIRDFLDENGFLEIETPVLTKSTPEGARDYLVPSRNYPGMFYALPQSPQLFKQLLMVSGFDRYFQLAKCFRDEDLRANRQPEFTQVDMEMSFVDQDDVMELNERLIQRLFKDILNVDIKLPIQRITYKDAMEKYGTDKPDLRFEMTIQDLTTTVNNCGFKVFRDAIEQGGSVRAIKVENSSNMSRKKIDKLSKFVKTYKAKGLAWIAYKEEEIKSSLSKVLDNDIIASIIKVMNAKKGDLILIVADSNNSIVFQSLGALRVEIAKQLKLLNNNEFKFTWITEFPLFSYSEDEKRYVAEHHPFTMPMDDDIPMLDIDPSKVRAKAYDLVLNGEELGGGSIRIHDTKLQEKIFEILGFSKEKAWDRFGFLLDAFKFGPPPHGGLAFGFDRMIMFFTGTQNIKDVIAFPKNQNAFCPLTEAPNIVDKEQLDELSIQVKSNKQQ